MSAAKVLLAAACVLATVFSGVDAAALLTFTGTAKAMTPTTFKVEMGTGAVVAKDRLEIHLPGFAGAYNSFGAQHKDAAAPATPYTPDENGIKGLTSAGADIANAFTSAEWDAAREVLKLTVLDTNVRGVRVDEKYLRLSYTAGKLPSGLGPLPPNGGIDANWYKTAWVRQYVNAKCTGGPLVDLGLGSDVCKSAMTAADFNEFQFDSAQVTLTTPQSGMPVQRIGAAGTAVVPTFSLLTAKGTKTGTGSINCMTVTMISNVALVTPNTNKVTSLTIHGLTGSSTASTDALPLYLDAQCTNLPAASVTSGVRKSAGFAVTGITDSDLFVSSASTKKTWQAVWKKDDGTVVFEIGEGRSISAGQVVVVSFALVNGPDVQDSRAVSASVASGYYCKTNLCLNTNTQAVSIPATAFHSSSKMLQIKPPTFETAVISQSTTDPERDAIITVTLKANKALMTASSFITISGICGTISNQDVALSVIPSTTLNPTGKWDETTKVLKITVGSTGLLADVEYVFSYTWKLVKNENAACPITITASGTNTFASAVMTNSAGSAGKVDAPKFKTLKIGQYTTRPGADNYVCVTLKTNYLFNSDNDAAGANGKSTVTLSGLLGSQKVDVNGHTLHLCPTTRTPPPTTPSAVSTVTIPVKPLTAGRTSSTYDFTQATGSAVFVMDSSGFVRGTEYVFAMLIKNNAGANPCQTVTLTASGDITQTATMTLKSAASRALQDGEIDGDVCALKTYAPGFHTKVIAQASKLADQVNVVTVTLRSNVDFLSTATGIISDITITGLTGTDTPDTTSITDLSTGNFVPASGTPFVPDFTTVKWVKATGVLTLSLKSGACVTPTLPGAVNVCIKAGATYVFAIGLVNGKAAQAAPAVSISVLYGEASNENTASQVMTAPSDKKLSALALLSKDTILDKYNIGQVVAQQDKLNAICVTLRTNKELSTPSTGGGSRFVAFTIKGLDGFQTDGQDMKIRTVDSAGATALSNTDTLWEFFCKTAECTDKNVMAFDEVKSEASFFLNSAKTMTKDTDYSMCFQVTNPSKEMACKTATISAKDSDTSTAAAIEFTMTQDTGKLTDHPTGSKCAGFTDTRHFSRATFRVDSNVTAFESTAIVELITNFKIGTRQVISIFGLSGFKAKGQGAIAEKVAVDLLTFTANGVHALDIGDAGSWDGTSVLTFTTGSDADLVLSSYAALDSTTTKDFVYELSFKIINPAVAQAAPKISIIVDNAFKEQTVDSGMATAARRRGLVPISSRRAGADATMFTFTASKAIYGGESIVLDLPHYTGVDGAVFGVTSSPSTAFTTYASVNEFKDKGITEDKARAMFTTGFVATGYDKSQKAGVADTLFLDADDPAYAENKDNWFAEGTIWSGVVTTTTTAAPTYGANGASGYVLADDVAFGSGTDAFDNALAGTIMTCTDLQGEKSQSRYILEGVKANKFVFVEQDFDTAVVSLSACSIAYKSTVGKYTGHTVMLEDGVEYVMKQGGGPFYSVSDGSTVAIAATVLDEKQYTVYSQLILTAAKGASIAKGETVTISIPADVVVAPADVTALVNKEDDATIAEKTTIKHMLVTTIQYDSPRSTTTTEATLRLSKTWPYAYDYKNEQSLKGSFVELFGAVSLLATGAITDVINVDDQVTLTTTTSLLSADDVLSHDAIDATFAVGFASAAIAVGLTESVAGVATDQFWTALADVQAPSATTCTLNISRVPALLTSKVTEPEALIGYDATWGGTPTGHRATKGNTIWLLDSLGQFLAKPLRTDDNDDIGLGVYVPSPVVSYTAATSDLLYGQITVADMVDNGGVTSKRAKQFSSSIRAAFTIVPAAPLEFLTPAVGCAADGSDIYTTTIKQGVSTCGSDLGISADSGSLADEYPCGVSVVIEGATAGGPTLSLPADMPADACFAVKILSATDMTWPTEEMFSANMDTKTIKAFKWGPKWPVAAEILSLDISGDLTTAINITSGIITEQTGAPTRRRLLAKCPTGYEYHMGAVGDTFADACKCPSACDKASAACPTKVGGNWTAILVPASACVDDDAEDIVDNTGAIVGGVVGGVLGLLLLCAIAYYCCRQEETGPVGRPPAPEKAMVPVYLPQSYPVIPAEYTAAAPMPEFAQPVVYPGSVQPMMQPYMVEQPQYVVEQQQPWMVQQQPVAYGM